jgi:hypothetical protein
MHSTGRQHPGLGALANCRYLHGKGLTGTLPAAWAVFTKLYDLWVIFSLSMHCW